MVHRGIATLAAALMLCFLLLSSFEPQFFLLHFYQSLIYMAMILMLFYFEDQWAYMIGMQAPTVWLLLTFATGVLGGAARQVSRLMHAQMPSSEVSLMAAVTAVLAVIMIGSCAYRWKREFSGLRKFRTTFFGSLFVVIIFYAILVVWFWNIVPQA